MNGHIAIWTDGIYGGIMNGTHGWMDLWIVSKIET